MPSCLKSMKNLGPSARRSLLRCAGGALVERRVENGDRKNGKNGNGKSGNGGHGNGVEPHWRYDTDSNSNNEGAHDYHHELLVGQLLLKFA